MSMLWLFPLLISVVFHEYAHGWVAYKLGDTTAKRAGRLTLNPIPHIDPIGTVLLPLLLWISHSPVIFASAKPVPVNFAALHNPKRDMGLVALAGPAMNMLLGIVFAWVAIGCAHLPESFLATGIGQYLIQSCVAGYHLSLALAAFNMLPILPLDGGRVVCSLLPDSWAREYIQTERYGIWVVLFALLFLPQIIYAYMNWFIGGLQAIASVFLLPGLF
ncbi:MAG: site-2 protease family protein [Alphaproteobacteria bacterium]|nr:site-2 protease family protein [Alphaproteobacteria bacterium]